MEDFDTLMKQAVSIKTNQMVQKRKKFEALPLFLKAGLYYLAKFANVRKQGFYQRYAVCDHLKGRGNKLFKEEKADLAAREYEQALSLLRYINNKNPNWKNEGIIDEDLEYINFDGEGEEEKAMSTNIKVALYNNLAACYLSLNDLQNAKAACDEALILDPTQAKAWFRRAKALISDVNAGLSEYKAAIEDLKKALELSPEDPVIQQALNKIKHDMIKVKNSGQSFKGIFQGKNEKKLSEDSSIEKTLTAGSIKDAQTSPNQREEQKEKSPPTQEAAKSVREETIQTKKEKVRDNEEKKEPNMKEAPKKSAPPNSVKTASDNKIEKNNDVWKMLHGDKDPNSNDYDYSLSYGAKENAEVPQEIAELEKFLEKRGNDLLRFYENSGKTQQAQELRENLRKAMAAKQRLEKIATLDFDKPNSQLKEVADKFGLDLNDPDIKDELKKIQSQNLDDIRNWINGMGPETDTVSNGVKSKKSSDKNRIGENLSSGNMTTTNNYYINNNYYSSGGDSKTKMMKDQKDHDLVDDVTKLKETESSSKVTRIMNLVIIAVAVGLFLVSLIMQTNRATVTKEM